MTFIRFQGCNLLEPGCVWCDTRYAREGNLGNVTTIDEVLHKVVDTASHYQDWVCITGGEPLFQPEALHELVKGLKKFGLRIEVETNGSIKKPNWWTVVDSWVADIKCPSSGVCGVSLEKEWFDIRGTDQVKFVVGNSEDLLFAKDMIQRNATRSTVVLVSPVIQSDTWGNSWLGDVAEFCKVNRVRYSLQIHKVIWGNRIGV